MASSGTVCTRSITISHSVAFRAALNWNADSLSVIRRFLSHQPQGLTQLDGQGNTILHFLALDGNANALKQLFEDRLLTNQDLRSRNSRGDTVLHEAARFGKRDVAEMILEKEKDLLSARNHLGETPLYTAAACGTEAVFDLLQVNVGREEVILTRNDGCTVLHAAVTREHYSELL
ncbi:Ankyrin repeat protein like [Actinidia chinensis var. chinensis]|uniref:Ankyrin repeat protein like n=1 Tax=Actinidia chinensis var. chinensis TaxID=1590841 RepID=A0A2R6RU32_ACTCC|nr:Ankyrin repeat protein like [Actinidia chinensis var. chinensis]